MTNLNRLKLELSNRSYFTDAEYTIFLEENGLVATEEYTKDLDELYLLQSILAILQALNNNIDLYMSISTEFTNVSSAYKNLKDRIDELYKRISLIPSFHKTNSSITYC